MTAGSALRGKRAWMSLMSLLIAPALAGCDLVDPGPRGVTLEPASATFLVEAEPIDPGTHPREAPADPTLVGSLLYQARVVPEDTVLGSEPMDLWIQVEVTNPQDREMILPVEGCTVWPEIHARPDRSGTPLWVPEGSCQQRPYEVSLASGESTVFQFYAYDVMLASAVPDGRYYVTARFRGRDRTLELPAGSADVRFVEPGLEYAVELRETEEAVLADVRVTNRNDVSMYVEYGHCALSLSLYRDEERSRPVARWSAMDVCFAYLAHTRLEPGATHHPREFSRTFAMERIPEVGDGTYFLTADLELNARTYRFPLGRIRVRR